MRPQCTLRGLFGWTTLAGGLAAGVFGPSPYGFLSLLVVLIASIALWPWLFGRGG